MERRYLIRETPVHVLFDYGIIHIVSDAALFSLLHSCLESGSSKLVALIKDDYRREYGEELAVKDDSMIVEIWGHVYLGALVKFITRIVGLTLISRFGRFISRHCDLIDCGQADRDGNRWFWDILAPQKRLIGKIVGIRLKN
jgi:hypothetical protein